ncbi:hypothetical protein GQ54DRAFT_166175 [Martensiomyces pterosporus]|nr:hypothetical protein GQ54DRAFT_166175 [Martensiomyces pterosporus]
MVAKTTALLALAALAAAQQQEMDLASISQNWNNVLSHASAALPVIQGQPDLLQQFKDILSGGVALPSTYDLAIVSRIESELPTQIGYPILGISGNGAAATANTETAPPTRPTARTLRPLPLTLPPRTATSWSPRAALTRRARARAPTALRTSTRTRTRSPTPRYPPPQCPVPLPPRSPPRLVSLLLPPSLLSSKQ